MTSFLPALADLASKVRVILLSVVVLGLSPAYGEAKPPPTLRARAEAHVGSLADSRVKVMLQAALSQFGVPYKWGGDNVASDGGFDCVGLAYASYHQAGMEFPLDRWTTVNMTNLPRGPDIAPVWWTAYSKDFAEVMQPCGDGPFRDGDVLVYHRLSSGKISDRTGHAVIVADAAGGLAVSAARSGVRVHALGDLRRYDHKDLTACWRAASAGKAPLVQPAVQWSLEGGAAKAPAVLRAPYITANPVDLVVSASGEGLKELRHTVSGRVLSLIGSVTPTSDELPAPPGSRRWRIRHDFHQTDLPVDPGERIPSPRRKLVVRLLRPDGLVAAEKAFYIQLSPYW